MEKEKDIMEEIKRQSRAVVKGVDEEKIEHWVTIYIMGKPYRVPAALTIMQAMEYAGYRFIRSCGCRAGFCGACSTLYRKMGTTNLRQQWPVRRKSRMGCILFRFLLLLRKKLFTI